MIVYIIKYFNRNKLILKKLEQIMATLADIQAQNEQLVAAVAAEDTVIDGAVTLIQGVAAQISDLKDQLAAAIANNDPVAMQAVVDSMTATNADITAKTSALAAAVAANTPAKG